MSRKHLVAIIGRPNVGKSSFFNYVTGRRISIVEDTPGVTRDRIYSPVEWSGRTFTMVDTGGLEPEATDNILRQMRRQAEIATELADVIIFMVDAKDGVVASDKDIATFMRKTHKPVILVVNKVDDFFNLPDDIYEFYNLGLGDYYCISSAHGLGIGEVLDAVLENLPADDEDDEDENVIKVAVCGKPNAGKSSLINKILGEDRVIVSDVAGTTRDAIDTYFTRGEQEFCFIDTAGMRKRGKITDNIERYSIMRSLGAIDRSDVVLIMIDGKDGVTEQDTKIAGYAHNQGKACILVVNKWDIVDKDSSTMDKYRIEVKEGFNYMMYAPVMFISALTGRGVSKLVDEIVRINGNASTRVGTGMLNDILNEATAMVQPPSDKGKRLKIYYMTQVSVKPPVFTVFVNDAELFHFSYQRYIENQIRKCIDFEGTPIVLKIKERDKE